MASNPPRGSTAPPSAATNGTAMPAESISKNGEVATVNRKKQKRREKQAAKLAAEQPSEFNWLHGGMAAENGHPTSYSHTNGAGYGTSEYQDQNRGPAMYSSDQNLQHAETPTLPDSKAKKKRKSKNHAEAQPDHQVAYAQRSNARNFGPPLPPPPPPPLTTRPNHTASNDRIWNTSTAEERERIKEFWLSLEETERRSLVKVEKEAVLKKMKEQQKHSCSCSVCGRKRTAIEEELEGLYDAYYDELEQYANHQQINLDNGTPMMPPSHSYSGMRGLPPRLIPPLMAGQRPDRGKIADMLEDEDEGEDEEFSDEEDDVDYSDEEPEPDPRDRAVDFFNFGNSLTVQGGILTVADDLLKNDGKKFIEMMEQLAERRMAREEEAQHASSMRHASMQGHTHGPPMEEDEYDEDDEDDYDSQDDDDYDEDEMETMTEEQRMEEGRRMFQIFAARMFEQRVLTAYREKVARERQEKLLEELADESRLDAEREAKKAKEAQKKKDKKRQQKLVKDEERAKREAEKAAEEAAVKAQEAQKLEEQRQKKEEQRKKREAEKRAQDEERLKKEADKQKRLQDAREQQAEAERKQREQRERERKRREEIKRKEKEERDAKELEAKEKREREAAERRPDQKAKVERDVKDRAKKDDPSTKPPQATPIAIPTILRKPTVPLIPGVASLSAHASPHLPIATPALAKAPVPLLPRHAQDSRQSSPKSSKLTVGSPATSPTSSHIQHTPAALPLATKPASAAPPPPLQSAPLMSQLGPPPGMHQGPFPGMPASGIMGSGVLSSGYPAMLPGLQQRASVGHESAMYSHQASFNALHYRSFNPPNGLSHPPGFNPRGMPPGRSFDAAATQSPLATSVGSAPLNPPYSMHAAPGASHSRNPSASFDKDPFGALPQTNPIARPATLKTSSSTPRSDEAHNPLFEVDELSKQLGSSALLDDSDEPLGANGDGLRDSISGGAPRSSRLGLTPTPMFSDASAASSTENYQRSMSTTSAWGTPTVPFGNPSVPNSATWSTMPGSGWAPNSAFGAIGAPNRLTSRPATIRLLACQACRKLSAFKPEKDGMGFHSIGEVLGLVDQLKPPNEGSVQANELLIICDTEGNAQNGGGSFDIVDRGVQGFFIQYEPDASPWTASRGSIGAPGQIGSPLTGHAMPSFGAARSQRDGHQGFS